MTVANDIVKLLRREGYRINGNITDAVDELVELADQENDEMELEDERDDEDDDLEDDDNLDRHGMHRVIGDDDL
jgi:hypothetical protein